MNNSKGLLLIVLFAQLAIAAWLYLGNSGGDDQIKGVAEFDVASLDALQITDAKDNKLRLSRSPTGWQAAASPADTAKVEALLEKLQGLQTAWPVATSADAQTRFEVADDKFQRRLQLYTGETLVADLLFGTSPGFRRVHLRNAGRQEIYSVDFANHELPVGEDDWLDRGLLALEAPVVSVQRLEHWSLARVSGADQAWELNGGPANQAAADTLAGRFTSLQVLGRVVLEGALRGRFVVAAGAGESQTSTRFALYHNEEMDRYYLTRNDETDRYEIAGYIAEQMLLDADSLEPAAEGLEQAVGEPGLAEDIVEQTLDEITGTTPQ